MKNYLKINNVKSVTCVKKKKKKLIECIYFLKPNLNQCKSEKNETYISICLNFISICYIRKKVFLGFFFFNIKFEKQLVISQDVVFT